MNSLIKKMGVLFFLLSSGISIAQDQKSVLDKENQSEICVDNTSSIQAEQICINEKIDLKRIAVCHSYTSSPIAESLCLKNNDLRTETIANCYLKTEDLLEEKVCLLYPYTHNSIVMGLNNIETFSKYIMMVKNDMEELLGFNVIFNMMFRTFRFSEDDSNYEGDYNDEYEGFD